MITFDIAQGNELLTSHSGLALIGALLSKTQLMQRLNAIVFPDHPKPEISHGVIATSMIGLLSLGKPDFEAIEPFRDDPFFSTSLGLARIPSEAALRQRLDRVQGAFDSVLKEESADMIKRHAPRLTPCHKDLIALDVDVSPFDNSGTKKEGVSWTYKKMDGYAPILAYLGEEGYALHFELREGSQHCQKGTPAFLRETIALARRITEAPLLLRMDAGHDSVENLGVCIDQGIHWIIKRNLRNESPEAWLALARKRGQAHVARPGKVVYRGGRYVQREGFDGYFRQVYEVTVRTSTADGQMLLTPEVEAATYETSLHDPPETIIALYHAHGTSEQFHSELKTDLDLERFPSGKFATNALILLLGMFAYNCLRLCGQEALREEGVPEAECAPIRRQVIRRRLRSVMQDLIYMASRVVFHARKWGLSFSRYNPWYLVWRRVYHQFIHAVG